MIDLMKSWVIAPIKILNSFQKVSIATIKALKHGFSYCPSLGAIEKNGFDETFESLKFKGIGQVRVPDFIQLIASFPCKTFSNFKIAFGAVNMGA